jgi:SAM-dependent methyltransferase
MFLDLGWSYTGLDLSPGHNVDIVAKDPFLWPIANDSFDLIVSGQMLEHNTMFWLTFLEMARVLKPGGMMFHIAPSRGYEHRVPSDCWRFYRDGMSALGGWCGLECIEATTDWTTTDLDVLQSRKPRIFDAIPRKGKFAEGAWGDTVGVFRKPPIWRPNEARRYLATFLKRLEPAQQTA